MKRRLLITLSAALLTLTVNGAALASGEDVVSKLKFPRLADLEVPQVDTRTLSNGIKVYILEDHMLPTVNASVRIAAGSYLEPAEKVGLASILGDVMRTGGTKKWTGDEIDEALEGVGATVESNMGTLSGNVFGNSLIEYTDLTLGILAEVIQHPTFDQDKIDITKTQIKGGISRRNDNAQQVASRIFSASLYGEDSPYARWEEYATVDAVTRDDLLEFHKRWIHPGNLQIAVWGDFKADDMFAKLEEYFGSWNATGEKAPPAPEVDETMQNRIEFVNKPDVNQTNIFIGHLGGKVQDEDYPTRLVMNNIFGGGFGSRLFSNVRSREGLAYATGGRYGANLTHPGRFFGFASTKSETTVKAMKEIIKQMESMKNDPPTKEEMSVAIDGYLNSFVFNFDTRSEVVNRMVQYDAYGLPMDFLSQVKSKVEKVTPGDVQKAAQEHFQLDKMYMVVVGKGDDFDEPLTSFGIPVDTVDITIPTGEPESDLAMTDENVSKGRELLLASADACGGADKFKAITSYKSNGSFSMNMGGQSMNMKATMTVQLPNKQVVEIQSPMGAMKMGFDGAHGWNAMGGQVMDMNESQAESARRDISRNIVNIFAAIGDGAWTPVYGGAGEANGESVEWVHLIDAKGDELAKIAVSASSKLPVAQEYFGDTPTGPANITTVFSDFRDVNGLKIPFVRSSEANGQPTQEVTLESMEIGGDLGEAAFSKPQG